MQRLLVLAMLLRAATPAVADAQDECADLPQFFARPPKIGEWAEFTWQEKGKTDSQQMRMAVVKQEQRQGKRMYWLQMVMHDKDPSKRTIVQTLTPWEQSSLVGENAVEVVMKVGNQPAMKTGPEHARLPAVRTGERPARTPSSSVKSRFRSPLAPSELAITLAPKATPGHPWRPRSGTW